MEYDKIEVDFVTRTKELISQYDGDFEVTLLINCCLGMLVLPREQHLRSIPNINLPENGELWGMSRSSVTVDDESCGYNLPDIIRRLRNGICHFKVRTIPDGTGVISKLEIKDRGKFKAELTTEQLKMFTTSLANHVMHPK